MVYNCGSFYSGDVLFLVVPRDLGGTRMVYNCSSFYSGDVLFLVVPRDLGGTGMVYNCSSFYSGDVLFLVVPRDLGGTRMLASREYLKLQTVNVHTSWNLARNLELGLYELFVVVAGWGKCYQMTEYVPGHCFWNTSSI